MASVVAGQTPSPIRFGHLICMTECERDGTTDVEYADLSAFQRDILTVLKELASSEQDSYGLEIKRRLEEWYDEPVNHGRLYPNLDDLVEWGLVRRGQLDKRTNEYTLTDSGYTLLEAHRERMNELLDE